MKTDCYVSPFNIFGDPTNEENNQQSNTFDPYDWDNPDNCSDDEYMNDDDYDDFDN